MNRKTKRLVFLAVLVAVMLLFGFTPIGIISIPPANATIMHIPVIIGALVLGLGPGLGLGAVFGAVSVYVAFTRPSVLVAPMMAESPALVIVMSVAARVLVPLVAWTVHKLVSAGGQKRPRLSAALGAAAGTAANTVAYLGLMLAFYAALGLDSVAVQGVIAGVGALNGSIEAALAVVICTPIAFALRKIYRLEKKLA